MRDQDDCIESGQIPQAVRGGWVTSWLSGDDAALNHLGDALSAEHGGDGGVDDQSRSGRGDDASGASELGAAPRSEHTPLLETKPNTVTTDEDAPRLMVSSCGCRSWFCTRCCLSKGLKLRDEIKPVLATFKDTLMLTLTIDPEAFNGDAEAAFRYVRENRCASRLMRELKRRGLLHSDRWFSVVEWQRNGFAHYHVIVDAGLIQHAVVHEVWNSYGPGPGRVLGKDHLVRLGFVSCNRQTFLTSEHAANYATKYLIKTPKNDFPDWVTQFDGRIRRYEKSRNFDPAKSKGDSCNDSETDGEESADLNKEERPQRRTIKQIIENCGRDAALFEVSEVMQADGELIPHFRFLGRLKDGWEEVKAMAGLDGDGGIHRAVVPDDKAAAVRRHFGVGDSSAITASCTDDLVNTSDITIDEHRTERADGESDDEAAITADEASELARAWGDNEQCPRESRPQPPPPAA